MCPLELSTIGKHPDEVKVWYISTAGIDHTSLLLTKSKLGTVHGLRLGILLAGFCQSDVSVGEITSLVHQNLHDALDAERLLLMPARCYPTACTSTQSVVMICHVTSMLHVDSRVIWLVGRAAAQCLASVTLAGCQVRESSAKDK